MTNPIPEVPIEQQRRVTRAHFDLDWPLKADEATLACAAGGVIVRVAQVSYAVNDVARAHGFALPDDVVRLQRPKWPSNALQGVRQEVRERMFRDVMRCRERPHPELCRVEFRRTHALSSEELGQIELEGRERIWSPLQAQPQSLVPLEEAGLLLCR